MKKLTITISKSEEISFEDLTEREKAIYWAGSTHGTESAGLSAIIGILILGAIVTIVLII